jgi:CD2 antigen cytoplasmic tail-binding protein 2
MSSRAVRFAANTKEPDSNPSAKRRREDDDTEDSKPPAKAKRYRPNEDELDDIDEWQKEEEDNDDAGDEAGPSERELLEAKRKRRQQRGKMMDGDGNTNIDESTSLAAEGIAIEPFHMRSEESDGAGYFDGDTYVFRKNDPNEEPDAWLDSLQDDNGKQTGEIASSVPERKEAKREVEDYDSWTKEQLYSKIIPLVSDTETVAQAVRRYGQLVQKKKPSGKKKNGVTAPSSSSSDETKDMAKSCLDDLTGAANALLLRGEVDIYDTTRQVILKLLPQHQELPKVATTTEKQTPAQWEYMGNQDAQMHGPYSTEQMIGWTQAGYFVGNQKVKIRAIRERQPLSDKDDLLADLMDDDDDDDDGNNTGQNTTKGEWMWSSEVHFQAYLPG